MDACSHPGAKRRTREPERSTEKGQHDYCEAATERDHIAHRQTEAE